MQAYKTGAEGLRLIKSFEGAPRLQARMCEGGAWELGYGCTFWPDNRPVREGQTITLEQVDLLLKHALKVFETGVIALVKVPLTQHQFDALVALAYNIGLEQFETSTVLRETNANKVENAAAAFGLWIKATSPIDDRGNPWLSPEGKPCKYRRALRGLLRRHYAEACVFLGYDWEVACSNDAIALRADKQWEPANNRWHDRIRWDLTTPFTQVLEVARKYPLSVPQAVDIPLIPVGIEPLPAEKKAVAVAAPPTPAPVIPSPPTPAPAPVIAVPPPPKDAVPANLNDPKDMALSRRFWGLMITGVGTTHFLPPAATSWINNEGNRELLAWLIVVGLGVGLYQYGKWKSSRPLK